jgi:hypothetical protein
MTEHVSREVGVGSEKLIKKRGEDGHLQLTLATGWGEVVIMDLEAWQRDLLDGRMFPSCPSTGVGKPIPGARGPLRYSSVTQSYVRSFPPRVTLQIARDRVHWYFDTCYVPARTTHIFLLFCGLA